MHHPQASLSLVTCSTYLNLSWALLIFPLNPSWKRDLTLYLLALSLIVKSPHHTNKWVAGSLACLISRNLNLLNHDHGRWSTDASSILHAVPLPACGKRDYRLHLTTLVNKTNFKHVFYASFLWWRLWNVPLVAQNLSLKPEWCLAINSDSPTSSARGCCVRAGMLGCRLHGAAASVAQLWSWRPADGSLRPTWDPPEDSPPWMLQQTLLKTWDRNSLSLSLFS